MDSAYRSPEGLEYLGEPTSGGREYGAMDNLGAMFRTENLLGSFYLDSQYSGQTTWDLPGDDDLISNGWTPGGMLEEYGLSGSDYDAAYSYIHSANTPGEARQRLQLYRERQDDLNVLSNMSLGDSLWTGAIAGISDPVVLGSMALTGGWGGLVAGGALKAGVRLGAIATAEQGLIEAGLHQMQPLRTQQDSITNLVAASTIGSVLGAGFGRMAKSPDLQTALDGHETALTDSLAATRYVPEVDEGLPFQSDIVFGPDVSAPRSESISELTARAEKEGVDPEELIRQKQADYVRADSETTPFAERGLVRGINFITRMQQSPIATLRGIGARLHGGSLASKTNAEGLVGDKIPAPVEFRIESASNRTNEVSFILDKYRKDYYGSKGTALFKEMWDGELDALAVRIMRGDGKTMDGPNGPVDLNDWQQRMYRDLENAEIIRYDQRSRKGYFADIIRRNGWDVESLTASIKKLGDDFELERQKLRDAEEKSIDKSPQTRESQRALRQATNDAEAELRARHQIKGDKLRGLLSLSDQAAKGSRKAEDGLIKILHGDKTYVSQSYNTAKLREIGEGSFVERALRSTKKKLTRLANDSDTPDFMRAEYRNRLDNWNEKAEIGTLKAAYKTLVKGESFGGMESELLGPNGLQAPLPSSVKTRQLMIEQDDFEMQELLDSSYMGILMRGDRQALPYIELKNAGLLPGTTEWNATMKQLDDEVAIRTHDMTSAEKAAFEKKVEEGREDLLHAINVLRNQEQKDIGTTWRTWASNIKALQVVRALGGVIFSNLADLGSNIMKNGGIVKMGKGWQMAMKRQRSYVDGLTTEDAGTAAGIYDMVAATTMHRMSNDVDGGLELGTWSQRLANATNKFMKLTGLPWLNQFNKMATVLLAEDRLIRFANGLLAPDKHDARWLAQNGWSPAKLKGIQRLYEKYPIHQENAFGLDRGLLRQRYMANPEDASLVTDMDLMDELGAFSNWLSSKNVVTPTAGDLPNFIATSPLAQIGFQFKSFSFSSVDKTLNPMIQGAAAGDFRLLEGVFSMWGLAIVGYMARQKAYNRDISDNYTQIAYEGLMRSGMLPLLAEGTGSFQKMTGNFFGAGEALGLEPLSRYYARDPITDWMGPAFGMIQEASSGISNANFKLSEGEPLTQQDYAKLARLLPYNNLFYLRALIEHLYDR